MLRELTAIGTGYRQSLLNAKQSFDEDEEEQSKVIVETGLDQERNQVYQVADTARYSQEMITKIFDPLPVKEKVKEQDSGYQ